MSTAQDPLEQDPPAQDPLTQTPPASPPEPPFSDFKIVDPDLGEFTLAQWEAHVEQARAEAEATLAARLESHRKMAIKRLIRVHFGEASLEGAMAQLEHATQEKLEAVLQAIFSGVPLEEAMDADENALWLEEEETEG